MLVPLWAVGVAVLLCSALLSVRAEWGCPISEYVCLLGNVIMAVAVIVAWATKSSLNSNTVLTLSVISLGICLFLLFAALALNRRNPNFPTRFPLLGSVNGVSMICWTALLAEAVLDEQELKCWPDWRKEIDICPYGSTTLWSITVPDYNKEGNQGLSRFGIGLNVFYALTPYFSVPGLVGYFLFAALVDWEKRRLFSWDMSVVDADNLWRVRHMQEAVHVAVFTFFAFVAKWGFMVVFRFLLFVDPQGSFMHISPQRPRLSCVTTCGMPNGLSLWAIGLLVYLFMSLGAAWISPHLAVNDRFRRRYTPDEMTRLGIHGISTKRFFLSSIGLLLLLGPVPQSQLLLHDASYEQVLLGGCLGALLALGLRLSYYVLFNKKVERTMIFRRFLVRLAWRIRHCRWTCRSFSGPAESRSPLREAELSDLSERGERGGGEMTERPNFRSPQCTWMPGMPPGLEDEGCETAVGRDPDAESSAPPGFEFLTIVLQHEVSTMQQKVDVAKKAADKAKRRQDEAEEAQRAAEDEKRKAEQEKLEAEERAEAATAKEERARTAADEANRKRIEAEEVQARAEAETQRLEAVAQQARQKRKEAEKQARLANAEKLKHQAEAVQLAAQSAKKEKAFLLQTTRFAELVQELQQARSSGDPNRLKEQLDRYDEQVEQLRSDAAHDSTETSYQQFIGLFKTLRADANDTFFKWQRCLEGLQLALETVKQKDPVLVLGFDAEKVFSMFMNAIDSGLDVPEDLRKDVEGVLRKWQDNQGSHAGGGEEPARRALVQRILELATNSASTSYGNFCFADLQFCLSCARDAENEVFCLKAVETLIPDEEGCRPSPSEMRSTLGQLRNLIKLISYMKLEQLHLTKKLFEALNPVVKTPSRLGEGDLIEMLHNVCEEYCGDYRGACSDNTLLREEDMEAAMEDPEQVVRNLKKREKEQELPVLGPTLWHIFSALAEITLHKRKMVMVPHHVQVVALLAFRRFLLNSTTPLRSAIARVGTGEGKSMLIAVLAAFVCLEQQKDSKRCHVHVVGSRLELVARDHEAFKDLFETLGLKSLVVRSRDDLSNVWDHDVVYCMPDDITLLYKKVADSDGGSFAHYKDSILLLDEVDALIVDGEPNDHLVRSRQDLGKFASKVVASIVKGKELPSVLPRDPLDAAEQHKVQQMVKEYMARAENFDQELSKAFTLSSGRYVANNGSSSNQLEVLNCKKLTQLTDVVQPTMEWFVRTFVVSKPYIFDKYSRILGFTGTAGNEAEQRFIKMAYRAEIVAVPEFLRTCSDAQGKEQEWHTAKWVVEAHPAADDKWPKELFEPAGRHGQTAQAELPRTSMVIESTQDVQFETASRAAVMARQHVPVLIIARSPEQARQVRKVVQQRCQRHQDRDVDNSVLDLSHLQHDEDEQTYLRNLARSTQRMDVDQPFRITVTDPTGARGTNYEMNDVPADQMGGLLLILLYVPDSERDWVQFQGRTARQQWRGQMCAVLCVGDYPREVQDKIKKLPKADKSSTWRVEDPSCVVRFILDYGQQLANKKLEGNRAAIVAGMRANQICEAAHGRELKREADRKLRDVREQYTSWTLAEFDQAAEEVLGIQAAQELATSRHIPQEWEEAYCANRAVVFALDTSGSMTFSREPKAPYRTFLDVCKEQVQELLNDKVRATDFKGLTFFDEKVLKQVPLDSTAIAKKKIADALSNISRDHAGNTFLYEAICTCLKDKELLASPDVSGIPRFLIVLTDGRDMSGEQPTIAAEALSTAEGVTTIFITLMVPDGRTEEEIEFARFIREWVPEWSSAARRCGGRFYHIPVDAGSANVSQAIKDAFDRVFLLMMDNGGLAE